jgi:histidine triad (HIT) family protein
MNSACIFCKIAANQNNDSTIVYQDQDVTAFRDIHPQAPTHILVIPNKHITSISDASEDDKTLLGKLMLTAAQIAQAEGIAADGYRLVTNTGRNGGQTVFHLHLHLLAGRRMTWPPG